MADFIPFDEVEDDIGSSPSFIPFDAVEEDTVPSLFSDPIKALTSPDWWLTRPGGEKISAAQAITGPLMQPLNAMTLGAGDEILAGSSSIIDALKGNDIGDSYDSRLNEIRGYDKSFDKAVPVISAGLGIAGALKALPGSLVSKASTLPTKLATLAGEGAGYGGAYGFGEGEGGFEERIKNALEAGKTGAIYSSLLGTPFIAAERFASKIAPQLEEQGKALNRYSMGARQKDYAKSAKELDIWDIEDDQIETFSKKALDYLDEAGAFGENRKPQAMLSKVLKEERSIGEKIGNIIKEVDNSGIKVKPSFENATKYVQRGRVLAKDVNSYLKEIKTLEKAINKKGKGKLSYLQSQKTVAGDKYRAAGTPEGDKSASGFWRAVYHDLQKTIEKHAPGVAPLNKELSKYKVATPILKGNLSQEEAKTWIGSLIQKLKTSGGTLTTPTLIGGTIGGTVGGPLGLGAGIALGAAASPSGQKVIGNTLKSVSKKPSVLTKPINKLAPVIGSLVGPGKQQQELNRPGSQLESSSNYKGVSNFNQIDPIDRAIERAEIKLAGETETAPEVETKDNLDPILDAIAKQESNNNPNARSSSGAEGEYQFMPATGRFYAKKLGVTYRPKDSKQQRQLARLYINDLLEMFNGDTELALSGYHSGEYRIKNLLRETGGKSLKDIKHKLGPVGKKYAVQILKRLNA